MFEINFTINQIIQQSSFFNCGWYALYFCQFEEKELIEWIRNHATYGSIRHCENIIYSYFNVFAKNIKGLNYYDFRFGSRRDEKCDYIQHCSCMKKL